MKTKKQSYHRLAFSGLFLLALLLCTSICTAQVTVTLSATPGTIAPTGTAQLTATVTGTLVPLKYLFNGVNVNGVLFEDSVNPGTITGGGIYHVWVTDTNYNVLGEAFDTVYSTGSPSGSFSIVDSVYSCAGQSGGGRIVLNYTGFFVPVTVTFSPFGTFAINSDASNGEPLLDTIAGFGTDTYSLVITDALGQTINTNVNVPVSTVPNFSSYITASPDTIEPGDSATITVHFVGGLPPYTAFINQNHDTVGVTINTSDSVYSFTTASTGVWQNNNAIDIGTGSVERCNVFGGQVQIYSACVAGQCVWPGDANWDGVVNNLDLLPIGIAYDSTGPVRPDTSIAWSGHYAANWTDSLQDSINYKYIDCNGDGLIDANDTLAIMQNYSLTYTRGGGFEGPRAGAPQLYPQVMEDTVYNGDTVNIQILLGSNSLPATNVYGLAFTLNYDVTVVDTSKTTWSFGNSWLGTGVDKISIAKDVKTQGQLQCALTRIDHTTKSGNGPIGDVSFVITTDNLNGLMYSYYTALFYTSSIKMVDSVGNVLPISAGLDSAIVGYLPTGIRPFNGISNAVHIYPNPANQKLMVTSGYGMEQIKITDVLGNMVGNQTFSSSVMATQQQFDISTLSPGIYMVEVLTTKGVAVKKLVVD